MKKILFGVCIIVIVSGNLFAQTSASATQVVDANLIDVVDLTFTGTGTNSGTPVALSYNTAGDFANGINSLSQQVTIVSTKNFNVTVKAATANFSYTGTATTNTTMPVNTTLQLKVTANSTGGTTSSTFNSFAFLNSSNQNLITTGAGGSNQAFSIQYKGVPSFSYSGGIYSVDIIYTVTQI